MQDMQVWPLGWEDPLEKEIAAHSSIIACKVPGTEEPGGPNNSSSSQDPTFWSRLTQVPLYFILQQSLYDCVCWCVLNCSLVSDSF